MALNLNGLKKFAEGEMTDVVTIVRDAQGTTDDTFNQTTGQYTAPTNDFAQVYHGPAIVMPLNVFPSETQEGGGTRLLTDYEMHIPITAQFEMLPRDVVTVDASQRNPHMVNEEFWVREVETGGITVTQKARIYRRETVRTI